MTKVTINNCLATRFPEVAAEWHPIKNGDIMPKDVIAGSGNKYWFICKIKHEWNAVLYNRTYGKRGCPYCANKKAHHNNCLQTLFPEISEEWHPTKNGDITPSHVICGSDKKYWFVCKKGHEWKSNLNNRTNNKTGCPYCANQKVCNDNCLQTLYPEISAEWHPTKNGDITPFNVIAGSNKNYWFQCKKGHEWESTLNNRAFNKRGCPYCSGKRVCNDNCLATKFPAIVAEWHFVKNNVSPKHVFPGSDKKYWFICKKGHEWEARMSDRTYSNNGCPCCSNRRVCVDNCLQTCFPEIADEWHPTKNGNTTPKDVVAGSHNKYWFLCKKGHEWETVLTYRTTSGKNGCPTCSESIGEKTIASIFKKLKIKYKPQFRFKSCKNKKSLPFDFIVRTKNGIKIIEYQGIQHFIPIDFFGGKKEFKELQERDLIKSNWCKERGVPLLAISYLEFDKIEEIVNQFIFA